jgi:V/A-type H+/Na+-transporting ATPase subunit I
VSIARLLKVTLAGCTSDKRAVLERLQDLGCLHIIPLAGDADIEASVFVGAHEALRFLLSSRRMPQQITNEESFDAKKFEKKALELRDRIDALSQERDRLLTQIEERRPWGNFKPPDSGEFKETRLWLYRVPRNQWKQLKASNLCRQVVGSDNLYVYASVLSEHEPGPDIMPTSALPLDPRTLNELESRNEEVRLALEDAEIERFGLSRYSLLLAKSLARADDQAALERVAEQTRDESQIFLLQAWIPEDRFADLQRYTKNTSIALEATRPDPKDSPPTKLQNREAVAGGEELVSFYTTPGYWLADPSTVVFFSFALFFAMIVSDAGYGLLLMLLTLGLWKRLGKDRTTRRWRTILAWISGISILYGILVGSYFGVEPRSGFLNSLKILDVKNYTQMMLISALIGAAHIILANLMNAWRYGSNPKALAPIGWAVLVAGGVMLGIGSKTESVIAQNGGIAALILGVILIVAFTSAGEPMGRRFIGGVMGLSKITTVFGDVLSYLRLFALGLASASLASVFNGMAAGLYHWRPGLGLLFAILVVLFGHAINLLLSVSGGFIHGLRLNVIEFFNWGVQEEGTAYHPFMKKENVNWNR